MSDYNHNITRVSCIPVFLLLFTAGTVLGGLLGLILAVMNYETVGLSGGAFIGLAVGLTSGIIGLAIILTFNILAPYTGGIPVTIQPIESQHSIEDISSGQKTS
ncbi:hypothetical protein [Propionispora sp. 2/2-37]|uniref:hypothetical protein n=1 Tax=Propionispora sp. 2/2-37 TaxID=1677858 RepID=UPI0012E1DD99|nr:hypothetical protein [Propionispora sp. 2/2-37]